MAISRRFVDQLRQPGVSPIARASEAINTVFRPKLPVVGMPGVPAQPGGMPLVNPMGTTPVQPLGGATQVPAPVAPAVPAPLPLPVTSSTAQLSRIDPANDLRSVQIAPTAGPSRSEIARQRLELLDREQSDQRQLGIRDIGRSAASLGRLNSGMVNTDLGNLESRLNEQRERTLLGLSADTAEGEISDARYNRGEIRGERDYQTSAAQRAQDNEVRRIQLEEALLGGQFGRDYDLSRLELGQANTMDANAQGSMGDIGALLQELARRKAAERAGILGEIGAVTPPSRLPAVG